MTRAVKILSAIAGGLLVGGMALALVWLPAVPVGSIIGVSEGPTSHLAPTVAAGRLAPDFKLVSLDGQAASLSAMRGKVVFLNLWATWCPPCREEMPSIQALSRHFQKDTGFVVLTVSEDSDPSRVAPFIKRNNFDFRVLLDPRNRVAEAYNVSGLPESFVIGRDGRIVAHHVGPYDWSNPDIREALQDLIKAKAG
jgi:peroxiredoxin